MKTRLVWTEPQIETSPEKAVVLIKSRVIQCFILICRLTVVGLAILLHNLIIRFMPVVVYKKK